MLECGARLRRALTSSPEGRRILAGKSAQRTPPGVSSQKYPSISGSAGRLSRHSFEATAEAQRASQGDYETLVIRLAFEYSNCKLAAVLIFFCQHEHRQIRLRQRNFRCSRFEHPVQIQNSVEHRVP